MTRKSKQRRKIIYERIQREGSVKVTELSNDYNVSSETIRKDLDVLCEQGKIEKKHGSANRIDKYSHIPLRVKREDHREEKIRMAACASKLIEDYQTIWLDAGSSVYTMLRFLSPRKNLTIATNSIEIATALAGSHHRLIVVGGLLEPIGQSLVGPFANEQIAALHFDLAFLGSDGFKNSEGPTTFAYEEIQIKRTALMHAARSVLLVDDSKTEVCAPYQYARFREFDTIVTTADPSNFPEPEKVIVA